jgi:RimJ/RimL family protein N-acetyltransferase
MGVIELLRWLCGGCARTHSARIAPAAVDLLSGWAFSALGLARLQLSIAPGNNSSVRVAEKAGYRYEGLLRSLKVIRGKRVDSLL